MKPETITAEPEHWDLEIKPKAKLLDLNLSEVWHYRDLLLLFVKRDFIAQYKQTILGPFWHLLQPIMTTGIFLVIFSRIARVPTDGVPPILFYLSGITLWNYFSQSLMTTSGTFLANASIFGKVYFPRLVMPLSVMLSSMVRLGVQLFLLALVIVYYHFHGYPFHLGWQLLYVVPVILVIAGLSLGAGIIISSLTTKYRDLSVLLGFGMQLMMYATPIVYSASYAAQSSIGWVIKINPLSPLVEMFRYACTNSGMFSLNDLLYSLVFTVVVLGVGLVLFHRVEKSFMDTI